MPQMSAAMVAHASVRSEAKLFQHPRKGVRRKRTAIEPNDCIACLRLT